MQRPRLRTADKVTPPYRLGHFPKNTIYDIAAGVVYLLATRGEARLEGPDWERIFAESVKADWTPSNIGLDDVRLGCCCWGAKTVKAARPAQAQRVRLISGRNSLDYSYKRSDSRGFTPDRIGAMVLGIWNERVSSVRQRFAHCRTVVLIKSNDLSECAVFESETVRFDPDQYAWNWNARNNLEGFDKETGVHRFTWQPHGSQFTVVEDVPADRLAFRIRVPEPLSRQATLKALGFDKSWVTIV